MADKNEKTKFAFTGDTRAPGHDPKSIDMYGKTFPFGKFVEVDDPEAIAKLRKNSHFTEDPAEATKRAKAAQEAEEERKEAQRDAIIARAQGELDGINATAADTSEEPGAAGKAVEAEAKEKVAERVIERTNGNPSIEAQPAQVDRGKAKK